VREERRRTGKIGVSQSGRRNVTNKLWGAAVSN
jgi:hypothetical protein